MRTSFCISTALLLLFSAVHLSAQKKDTLGLPGIFDLLQQEEGLKGITVETDLSYLVTNKKTADEYIDGTFTFETSKNASVSLPVKVKCRGRYRRMKCDFPPLKLKFKKDDLAAHHWNGFNELKLVTHCMDEKAKSQDLILRECLAYKLYNILTPNSLRAQLVKVDYVNTKRKPKKIKGWGILIEDSDELAARMNGEKYQRMGVPIDSFNLEQEQVTALFNYMIGNTDWSRIMMRNLELINTGEGIMTVPYDFDFAAMVDAPYAVPNVGIGQKSIKDRCYLGHPCPPENMEKAIQLFLDKKEDLFDAVSNANMLSFPSKNEIRTYLNEFYKELEDREQFHSSLFKEEGEQLGKD